MVLRSAPTCPLLRWLTSHRMVRVIPCSGRWSLSTRRSLCLLNILGCALQCDAQDLRAECSGSRCTPPPTCPHQPPSCRPSLLLPSSPPLLFPPSPSTPPLTPPEPLEAKSSTHCGQCSHNVRKKNTLASAQIAAHLNACSKSKHLQSQAIRLPQVRHACLSPRSTSADAIETPSSTRDVCLLMSAPCILGEFGWGQHAVRIVSSVVVVGQVVQVDSSMGDVWLLHWCDQPTKWLPLWMRAQM